MDDKKLKIRKAIQTDIVEIEALYKARVLYNDQHHIHQWNIQDITWDELSKLYTLEDCYVGIFAGNIACVMMLVDEDVLYWPACKKGTSLYLHKICVHPRYRGCSFADQMISSFKEKGKLMGYTCVRLDVRSHKKKLREMYERHGFLLVQIINIHEDFSTALYEYKIL